MGTHISVTLTIMMKFTPETSQSDSNSSNANFSVSLAVMPIVRSFLQRSVTNCIKLSHLQKSSPIRGSLGFKGFHSSAPALQNAFQLKIFNSKFSIQNSQLESNAFRIDNKKMLDRADAIDNKKMYTRLVSLLLGKKQYCAQRVIDRVSDADEEAETAVLATRRKEYLNLIAALSQAGDLDITKCQLKSLNDYFPADEPGLNVQNCYDTIVSNDLVVLRKDWKVTNYMLVADLIDVKKKSNREKYFKGLVAEINDIKAPNNMLVNADAIDNFKKLDRADAIDELNDHVMGLISCDRYCAARVINRVSDADWEAETAVLAARCKEVFNLTVAKSLKENLDITKCSWNSLNDYFPMISNEFGIYEEDFNDLVAEINDC